MAEITEGDVVTIPDGIVKGDLIPRFAKPVPDSLLEKLSKKEFVIVV
jgi:hypothetical protein